MSLTSQIPMRGRVSSNKFSMKKQEDALAALLAKLKEEDDKSSGDGGSGGDTLKGLRGDEAQRAAYKDAISTKMRSPTKPF